MYHNLQNSYHQINFSSMDKNNCWFYHLWVFMESAGNQLQMMVRPVTCTATDTDVLACLLYMYMNVNLGFL
jgi:hypothetical protein